MQKDEEKKIRNERKRNKGREAHLGTHVSFQRVSGGNGENKGWRTHSVEETVQPLTTTMSLIESAKGVVHKLFAINPHSAQMA